MVVVTNGTAQLLQPQSGRVKITAAGFAPTIFGVDLFELAVVDGIEADALVAASCQLMPSPDTPPGRTKKEGRKEAPQEGSSPDDLYSQ